MSFSSELISTAWIYISAIIYLLALGFAFKAAPWRVIRSNRVLQHMLFGATVLLMILWSMRAGISPGLGIHFLGLTVMTLVFGWDLAILSATVALIGMALIGKESWDGLWVNGVCSVLLPVLTTRFICWYVERKMMKNFFIFLFVCGFIGAGVSTAVAGLATSAVLVLDGVYPLSKVYLEYIRYLPLIMFPEGLLNGIFLTGMLVFHPDWVREFEVEVARSAEEAEQLLKNWMPDFATVDLKMEGHSGLSLIPSLRQLNPEMKILMLTGYASIATAVEAIKLGATQYLPKPADADQILAALNKVEADAEIEVTEQPMSVNRLEWEHIQKVLNEHEGNISATARALGMHRRTLQRKLAKRPVKR